MDSKITTQTNKQKWGASEWAGLTLGLLGIGGLIAGIIVAVVLNTQTSSSSSSSSSFQPLPVGILLTFGSFLFQESVQEIYNFEGTQKYRVEVRMKASEAGAGFIVGCYDTFLGGSWFISVNNDNSLTFHRGPSTNAVGGTLTPGIVYDITMTYDGSTLRGFLNGVQVASAATVADQPAMTTPLHVGATLENGINFVDFLPGTYYNLNIYNDDQALAENLVGAFAFNQQISFNNLVPGSTDILQVYLPE
jgi:hypothetical protein